MKTSLGTFCSILLLTVILALALLPGQLAGSWDERAIAYIEPGLLVMNDQLLQVLVTAQDMRIARRAVEAVGGEVHSELWLVDAVAAQVPAAGLIRLATSPGVISIVEDRAVEAALDPYSSDGWVSDRRRRLPENDILFPGNLGAPLVVLPDGGVFAVLETGLALIANPDGSERIRVDLNDGGLDHEFSKPVEVDGDGNIYLASTGVVYKLNPQGDMLWSTPVEETWESFAGGIALGSDLLYVADVRTKIYAFDVETGDRQWVYAINDNAGRFFAPPVAVEDGTVYCIGEHGFLTAINPDGTKKWDRIEDVTIPEHRFLFSPIIGTDGSVYVNSVEDHIYAFWPDGSRRYHIARDDAAFIAPAIVGSDGSLYIGSLNGNLYAREPDGSRRYTSMVSGGFITTPLLSQDGAQVFVVLNGNKVLAFDAQEDLLNWEYELEGYLFRTPTLAPNGNLHFVDTQSNYYILTPQGERVFAYGGFTDFYRRPVVNADGVAYLHSENKYLVTLGSLLDEWDGGPDVMPGSDPRHVRMVYPFSVDTGADIVHENGVTGEDVTVAVVDSGVYFDAQTRNDLGHIAQDNFLGQADFFAEGICPESAPGATQYADHCFSDYMHSYDGFGHGSHVAGIIWNNLVDEYTGAWVGVAPQAQILSVRVLGDDGSGSYADVIEGIQYVVANKDAYGIRVMNLSLSATPATPYFVDPINRAVERAWAAGIVVLAAAGNVGDAPETVTVPGNDPYVITVGSVNGLRTPGYWADDKLVSWASSGPTMDGFIKPDVLAPGMNIVSFMYNAGVPGKSAYLVQQHPDYSSEYHSSLFRMNGTSMATAVASGVVALMLEAEPELTPDEVKFRLSYSALHLVGDYDQLIGSLMHQGSGRLWAPNAVFEDMPAGNGNAGMDIQADLAHGWQTPEDLAYHYEGPVSKVLSADGGIVLYYIDGGEGTAFALGGVDAGTGEWLTGEQLQYYATFVLPGDLAWVDGDIAWESGVPLWSGGALYDSTGAPVWEGDDLVIQEGGLYDFDGNLVWSDGDLFDAAGRMVWSGGRMVWSGGNMVWTGGNLVWDGGDLFDSAGNMVWSGGNMVWSGGLLYDPDGNLVWSDGDLFDAAGNMVWSGGRMVWSGGNMVWSGGHMVWSGGNMVWSGGRMVWSGGNMVWSGGNMVWSGGRMVWSGGNMVWSGSYQAAGLDRPDSPTEGMEWVDGDLVWSGGNLDWAGGQLVWQPGGSVWPSSIPINVARMQTDNWVDDDGTVEPLKETSFYTVFVPLTVR